MKGGAMNEGRPKVASLYEELVRLLENGEYVPGECLDIVSIAQKFRVSTTPVRDALFRLAGQGILLKPPHQAFQTPAVTEAFLEDFYGFFLDLLLLACKGLRRQRSGSKWPALSLGRDDVPDQAGAFFDHIANATGRSQLATTVYRANVALGAIRRAERILLKDAAEELADLQRAWEERDTAALKVGLISYHRRRRNLTYEIATAVNEPRARSI
jgi:DNA-binding GntR family transcriptional regulator